ncbi:MAG TPA: fibronectin type III domain-containing protein, partial [Elusimicrobiales bacterium]|nr:fibronectin type III domain-containing protein [Elusimicrobiales bacterium]
MTLRGIRRLALAAALIGVSAAPVLSASDIICAEVKLSLAQHAALEREAFDATLDITNSFPNYGLLNFKVDVIITDEQGNPANDKFFIAPSTMTGITAVDGSGVVQPASTAEARWLIIPSTSAGGIGLTGVKYYAKANLSYVLNGVLQEYSTAADYIVVKPQPSLDLEYFLPFEVIGDEPLTASVEPVEPFALGLRVVNSGYGTAKNLRINSGQPSIVENKQGLLIGFQLLNSWLGGNALPSNTLDIAFGDIAPNTAKVAQWRMSTTLSGRFTQFSASFSHASELGGALTSLINSVTTYTLVRDVLVDLPGRDKQFDFLVNISTPRAALETMFSENVELLPDLLLESDSLSRSPVYPLTAELSGDLGGSHSELTLNFTQSVPGGSGWAYASVPAPMNGAIPLNSVVRADGKAINAKNYWISRHYDKNTTSFVYKLHLLDYAEGQTQSYKLGFDSSQLDQPPAAVSDLNAVSPHPGACALNWTAGGEDLFSGTIYNGKYAIFYSTDLAAAPQMESAEIVFSTTTPPTLSQNYVATGLLGNATYQFVLWTADAQIHYSTESNKAVALTYAYAPESFAASEISTSGFTLAWSTARNMSGTDYRLRLADESSQLLSETAFLTDATQYAFTDLVPNTTYQALAQARDSLLRETNFAASTAVVTLAQMPAPGSQTFDSLSNSGVHLAWLSNGNPAGTEYEVQYSTSPEFADLAGRVFVSSTAYEAQELASNSTYYFRVAAVNHAKVRSGYALLGSTVTYALPADVKTVIPGLDTLEISWSTASAAGYVVELATSDFASGAPPWRTYIADASLSSHTFSGLEPDARYFARVAAMNWASAASYGNGADGVTLASPPQGMETVVVSSQALTVSWADPGLKTHALQVSTASDFGVLSYESAYDAVLSSADISGLRPNTTYFMRLGNLNSAHVPNYLSPISTITLAAVPSEFRFSQVAGDSLALAWSSGGNPGETAYVAD